MSDFAGGARDIFDRLDPRGVADILIIAAVFLWILVQLRGTTAMALLRGIAFVLVAAWVLSSLLDLRVMSFLVRNSLTGVLIAIPIIFQPELRRALERLGRLGIRALFVRPSLDESIDSVIAAAFSLSRKRHGALIVLERQTGLQDYIETGKKLDAAPTPELIEGIFFPNAPLHDGAVILRDNRLVAAGCTLPLAESPVRGVGTRHRAALGIAERTDAVTVVVSEESGNVSLAFDGRLVPRLDQERLRATLYSLVRGDNGVAVLAQRRRSRRRPD